MKGGHLLMVSFPFVIFLGGYLTTNGLQREGGLSVRFVYIYMGKLPLYTYIGST